MSTNLEYRERETQRKRERRREASEAQREKGRQKPKTKEWEIKNKGDIFLFCSGGYKMRNSASGHQCKVKISGSEKKWTRKRTTFLHKRPIHTRDFAPGACSRGTLQEQSSSVCTNDFMGILHPREHNFHPAKCSTIFNQLNIWEQAPGANLASLKTLPRVYWHVQSEPGACSGSKTPRVYRP